MKKTIIATLLILHSFAVFANPSQLKELLATSLKDWEYARYDLAKAGLDKAETLLPQANSQTVFDYLAQRIDLHTTLAEFDLASEYVDRGAALDDSNKENMGFAHFMEASASYYFERYNSLARSRAMLASALVLKQKLLGMEIAHPELLKTRTLLAINYHKGYGSVNNVNGKVSAKIAKENIELYEQNGWESELWYGQSLRIYGISFYFFHFDSEQPKKGVDIIEKQLRVELAKYGKYHPSVGQAYHNLANMHHLKYPTNNSKYISPYKKAIEYARMAREIRAETLGEQHYYTLFCGWLKLFSLHYLKYRILDKEPEGWLADASNVFVANMNGFIVEDSKISSVWEVPTDFSAFRSDAYPRYLSLFLHKHIEITSYLLSKEKSEEKIAILLNNIEKLAEHKRILGSLINQNAKFDYEEDAISNHYSDFYFPGGIIDSLPRTLRNRVVALGVKIDQQYGQRLLLQNRREINQEKELSKNRDYQDITRQISSKKEQIANLMATVTTASFDFQKIIEANAQIYTLEASKRVYVRQTDSALDDLEKNIQFLTLRQIQQNMPENIAFVNLNTPLFAQTGKESWVALRLITKDTAIYIDKKIPYLIQENIEVYNSFMEGSLDVKSNLPYRYAKTAYLLYEVFLKPFEQYTNGKKIIFVTRSLADHISFAGLITQPANRSTATWGNLPYLANSHSMSYHYSASAYLQDLAEEDKQTKHSILGIAPFAMSETKTEESYIAWNNSYAQSYETIDRKSEMPLENSGFELTALKNLIEGDFMLAEKATKRQFLESYTKHSIIHLATHADTANLHSVIRFFNEQTLSDLEIAQLDFSTKELIVFSACRSNSISNTNTGDGYNVNTTGLARSALFAGAKSTVASAYKVSDQSSAQIFKLFYKKLSEGLAKDVALQKAMNAYLSTTKEKDIHNHPKFWANWKFYGKPNPIELKKPKADLSEFQYISIGFFSIISVALLTALFRVTINRKKNLT